MLSRCLLIVALGCGLCLPALGQDAKKPTLRWLGQSFFVLETSKGTRVAFDPHAIDAFERPKAKADIVLISHPHPDHSQLDAIENRATAKVFEGVKIPQGAPPSKGEWAPVNETIGDVKIRSVPTYHDTTQGFERGKNTVFIVQFDGLTLAHLGDLGHLLNEDQIRQIGAVDVLLIPVGGVYTLNGDKAKKVVRQLKPRRYVVPMHYGTRTFEDLLPPDEFLEGQLNIEKKLTTNELVFDPKATPGEPVFVLLGHRRE